MTKPRKPRPPGPAKAQQDRHKPSRMVRIPEPLARLLEELAEEEYNGLTEQVRIAVRSYLVSKGKLRKAGPGPASD